MKKIHVWVKIMLYLVSPKFEEGSKHEIFKKIEILVFVFFQSIFKILKKNSLRMSCSAHSNIRHKKFEKRVKFAKSRRNQQRVSILFNHTLTP